MGGDEEDIKLEFISNKKQPKEFMDCFLSRVNKGKSQFNFHLSSYLACCQSILSF